MAKPCDTDNDWKTRKDRIIGLGERSFHKSYYPQLKQNLDRLERFHTLLDSTSDFVLLVSLPEGTITDANAALGRLINVPVDQLIGSTFEPLGLGDASHVLAVLSQDMNSFCEGEATATHWSGLNFHTASPYSIRKVMASWWGVM